MRLLFIILISFTFFSCANNLATLANIDKDLKNSVNDQETSLISVNCTDNQVALFKKEDWTNYKNARGVFKKILNEVSKAFNENLEGLNFMFQGFRIHFT